jgi:hypothetical protein
MRNLVSVVWSAVKVIGMERLYFEQTSILLIHRIDLGHGSGG